MNLEGYRVQPLYEIRTAKHFSASEINSGSPQWGGYQPLKSWIPVLTGVSMADREKIVFVGRLVPEKV